MSAAGPAARVMLGVIALAAVVAAALFAHCRQARQRSPKTRLVGPSKVWVIDDGARIASDSGGHATMRGEGNPLWAPGDTARLVGLPGEVVALQVVVTAGAEPLSGVNVELTSLKGPDGGRVAVERFVVHELPMARRSGGRDARESLGWSASAMPLGPAAGSALPDPLIPISLAPAWADYPMRIDARHHRLVWLDLVIPGDAPPGAYRGKIQVYAGSVGAGAAVLDVLPIELRVAATKLPYAPIKTMVFFEPEIVERRIGDAAAVARHQQLMHRHHLSTIFPIRSAADVTANLAALTGELYTATHDYSGPGIGQRADVVVVGAYGVLREPTPERLVEVDAILEALAAAGLSDRPGELDIFLYAVDEQCDSDRGPAWRAALDGSHSERLRALRVGHTCSEPPAGQPVDLVMMLASAYRPSLAAAGRAAGKRTWIYNGVLPATGSFLTDSWPISLRANAWIQAQFDIERWFYWESTFWHDGNRGGRGPYDPLATAETFHNDDGDHCNGDGVLVYPGRQVEGDWRDLGYVGTIPSMRLKQWRRGISDAGDLGLARKVDRAAADAVARQLVGHRCGGMSGTHTATTEPAVAQICGGGPPAPPSPSSPP